MDRGFRGPFRVRFNYLHLIELYIVIDTDLQHFRIMELYICLTEFW